MKKPPGPRLEVGGENAEGPALPAPPLQVMTIFMTDGFVTVEVQHDRDSAIGLQQHDGQLPSR